MSWLMAPNVQALMDSGDVGGLVAALKYKRKTSDFMAGYSRSNAAKALWQLGQKTMDSGQSEKATKALCRAMGDIDQSVCLPAIGALGAVSAQLGKGPARRMAMKALVSGLADRGSEDLRALAAQGLRQVTIGWAHKPLFEGMKYHLQAMVNDAAATLAEISRAAFPSLAEAAGDSSAKVRAASVISIGMLADPRSVEVLAKASEDGSDLVREAVVQGLGFINDPGAAARIVSMLRDKAQTVRNAAVSALDARSWTADSSSSKAAYGIAKLQSGPVALDAGSIAMLVADIRERDSSISSRAVELLSTGGASVSELLVDSLAKAQPFAYKAIFSILAKIGSPSVEALIKSLRSEAVEVRKAAVEALKGLGDARAVEPLFELLADKHDDVREACAVALSKLGHAKWEELFKGITPSQGKGERFRRLYSSGDPRVFGLMMKKLGDSDGEVRTGVVHAMGIAKDQRFVEPLIAALADGDDAVRLMAAEALGKLGDKRAIEPLVSMLADPAPGGPEGPKAVSREVVVALDALGWQPTESLAGARFCFFKRDWSGCARVGEHGIDLLLQRLNERNDAVAIASALSQIGDGRTIEPLIGMLYDLRIENRKAAAEALVSMYSRGLGSDEKLKKRILEQRAMITQRHENRQVNHRDRPAESRPNDCDFPHGDEYDHEDTGIGVAFPI